VRFESAANTADSGKEVDEAKFGFPLDRRLASPDIEHFPQRGFRDHGAISTGFPATDSSDVSSTVGGDLSLTIELQGLLEQSVRSGRFHVVLSRWVFWRPFWPVAFLVSRFYSVAGRKFPVLGMAELGKPRGG
jgi:hypothetical protein